PRECRRTATGAARVPDLDIELTRREQQVLNVLHRSPYPLRHEQLAALVWSEPDRTHDVRSVLYRLRRKLRTSGWLIPFPPKGRGYALSVTRRSTPRRGRSRTRTNQVDSRTSNSPAQRRAGGRGS